MGVEDEYQQLAGLLRARGLAWLVEHVEEDIRAGKLAVAKRRTLRESRVDESQGLYPLDITYSSGPTEEFTVPEQYTPEEKLGLLLEGIRRVIVDPVLMQESIAERLGKEITGISFVPEESGEIHDIATTVPEDRLAVSRELLTKIVARLRELKG